MNKHLSTSEAWSTEIHRAGVEIRVLTGTVWLTQESDPEDHVLVAPAVFSASHHGRVAMEALTPADVEVGGPSGHGLARAA